MQPVNTAFAIDPGAPRKERPATLLPLHRQPLHRQDRIPRRSAQIPTREDGEERFRARHRRADDADLAREQAHHLQFHRVGGRMRAVNARVQDGQARGARWDQEEAAGEGDDDFELCGQRHLDVPDEPDGAEEE